jgi:hypothetical protein
MVFKGGEAGQSKLLGWRMEKVGLEWLTFLDLFWS